ncbi:MAG: DNA polymerase III subunit gamma/tau [Dehalococcoidia bacterium]|nr:DNA polymerase III subunit gamma/tau [Dehalococcoidia bacterium]
MEYNNGGMSSQVFYRKWRPQNLSEVVGQEHVTQTLRHAVAGGRVAHAYLFCGPRGTGKTSTGRILAKAINCLNPEQGEPCNSCALCKAINESSAPDIIEIDAASNRGIDEIRDLREKVNYSPNLARYKVYIIDEVHMITKEASNAFLKTLEEPPPHAIFILATTEPHKVLSTIMSRCQRFDFHRLSQSAVIFKLNLICEKENIKIASEALRLIAKVSTGSLRDSENLLEQLVTYYGHEIELHQVQEMLGISGDLRIRELARHIVNKDITAGLKTINSVASDGLDLRQFNRELVDYLRELLLVKSGSEEVLDVTSDDLIEIKELATGADLDYFLIAVKRFGEIDLRLDNYSSLPLELALVDCILAATGIKEPIKAKQPETEEPAAVATRSAKSTKTAPEAKTQAKTEAKASAPEAKTQAKTEAKAPAPAKSAETQAEPIEPAKTPDVPPSPEMEDIRNRWKDFVNAMRGEGSKGNLDAFLRSSCEPMSIEDNTLTLGFYHKFHKEYIEDPKYKHLVEKKLHEVFGRSYQVRCVLTAGKAKSKSEGESPLVKAAKESYGATVVGRKPRMEEE